MVKKLLLLTLCATSLSVASAQNPSGEIATQTANPKIEVQRDTTLQDQMRGKESTQSAMAKLTHLLVDNPDADELLHEVRNMPNIEVGRGISFEAKNKFFKTTMRFRMQNLVAVNFNENFDFKNVSTSVRRLRLRFDGYMFSPRLTYSIQLGFSPDDCKPLPNGNMNIVRDAMLYYVPNSMWSVGFGQTKIRGNRATVNSSSALQFVDRSIVNKEFSLDRDFGVFGEFHTPRADIFALSVKGSITSGDGRNWGSTGDAGFAYTGRVELFPMGRFSSKGDIMEGDFFREQSPKLMLAATYSFNDRAHRLRGESGSVMPDGATRTLQSYFVDMILKYRGFALYADFMGRGCLDPTFEGSNSYIFVGQGLNVQTSYLFKNNWEVALRNSTLFPSSSAIVERVGYERLNQTTLGVTKYIIGHTLKVQADISYNALIRPTVSNYNGWEFRVQLELGI